MHGKHLIKTWSVTQKHVTLSTGEAELMAMTKGVTEAIGMAQMLHEWNRPQRVELRADARAVTGIDHRAGNGKLRHVRINDPWLQETGLNDSPGTVAWNL